MPLDGTKRRVGGPDTVAKKQKQPNAEKQRQRELALRSKLNAYETALSEPAIRRLIQVFAQVELASDPTPGQQLDKGSSSRSQWDRPEPGSSTRRMRGLRKRMVRQMVRLADEGDASLNDPSWRPIRGPRCPGCGRTGRVGDKFCGSCSSDLEGVE